MENTVTVNTMSAILHVGNQVNNPRFRLTDPYTGSNVDTIQVYLPIDGYDSDDVYYLAFLLDKKRDGVVVNYTKKDLSMGFSVHPITIRRI